MWKDATRMNSTWRSGESRGYCDLHRRGFETGPAVCWSRRRIFDASELLGECFWTNDGEGDRRGSPFDFGGLEDEFPVPSDVRIGSVTFIFFVVRGRDSAERTGIESGMLIEVGELQTAGEHEVRHAQSMGQSRVSQELVHLVSCGEKRQAKTGGLLAVRSTE